MDSVHNKSETMETNTPKTEKERIRLTDPDNIVLPTKKGFANYPLDDVLYCEADVNYTNFYFVDGKKIVVIKSLKYVENCLKDSGFYKIHRKNIINLKHLKEFCIAGCSHVLLINDIKLEVSTRRKNEFAKLLKENIFKRLS